jgi:hypothetical protein
MNRIAGNRLRRNAVTLIEAVLFISIALALIVGGLAFYQQASWALRTEKTVRLVSAIVAEVRSVYNLTGRDPSGFGNVAKLLHVSGALPRSSYKEDSGLFSASGGGQVPVVELSDGTEVAILNYDKYFEIFLWKLPSEVCGRIASYDYATSNGRISNGVYFVQFNWHYGGGVPNKTISERYHRDNPTESWPEGVSIAEASVWCDELNMPNSGEIPGLIMAFTYE